MKFYLKNKNNYKKKNISYLKDLLTFFPFFPMQPFHLIFHFTHYIFPKAFTLNH